MKNPIGRYIDNSGKCPCCSVQFGARVTMLNHVGDKRRTKCRDYILANRLPLDVATVAEHELADNELRKAGRKAGRSHHIVRAPAVNRVGRTVGRASM